MKSLQEKNLIYAPNTPKKVKGKWVFQQDNSPVHKSKVSMSTVEELVGKRFIPHPPLSPDFNPIEDMWSYLDRKVKQAQVTVLDILKGCLKRSGRIYHGV